MTVTHNLTTIGYEHNSTGRCAHLAEVSKTKALSEQSESTATVLGVS